MSVNKKKIFSLLFAFVAVWSLSIAPAMAQDIDDGEEDIDPPTGQDEKILACCEKEAKPTTNDQGQSVPGAITTENITEKSCDEIEKDYLRTDWYRNKSATANKCEDKPPEVETRNIGDPVYFTPQVTIPESEYAAGSKIKVDEDTSLLANYIVAIFKYAIGVIGILAAIILMIGGVRWLMAGGNSGTITEAKAMIMGSLAGLILTLGSFLLLSTINTDLVNFKIQAIKPIQKMDLTTKGCCLKTAKDGKTTSSGTDAAECAAIRKKDMNENGYKEVQFFLGYEPKDNECKKQSGCCQVTLTAAFGILLAGTEIRAFDVKSQDECKFETLPIEIPGAGLVSKAVTKFNFMSGYVQGENDLVMGQPTKCIKGSNTAQQETGCINTWQWGCTRNADCCTGLKCVFGYASENGGGNDSRCESCIPQFKWGCESPTDCCSGLQCVEVPGQNKKRCE